VPFDDALGKILKEQAEAEENYEVAIPVGMAKPK